MSALLLGSACAQGDGTTLKIEAVATGSWMTIPKTPVTDLTTPVHGAAFRMDISAMWLVVKDTTEWGAPVWIGAGGGVMRWGEETNYPLFCQMILRPFKRIDGLRVDVRLGGAFGPWKESATGHVAIGMINEMGLRYRSRVGQRMFLEPRFHIGAIGVRGPMGILEEGIWKDDRSYSFLYTGAGIVLTF